MRIVAGSLEYAQARMQARHGRRPDEAAWRRLEVIRDYPALLEAARAGSLGHWVQGIAPGGTVHQVEAALRERWRGVVDETADWMPQQWQPAVRWCAKVIDLPVLAHLMRGGAPYPWMNADRVYRDLVAGPATGQPSAPGQVSAWPDPSLDALRRRAGDAATLFAAWGALWRERMPAQGGEHEAIVEARRAFELHVARLREATAADGWPLRRALQARLQLLFRRCALDPRVVFVYLGLQALEAERLRGELLRRAAFPRLRVA